MTKHNSLTVPQQAKLFALLGQHVVQHDDGSAEYAEGWDDKRIAEELGCSRPMVTYRRTKLYPHWVEHFDVPVAALSKLQDDMAVLEENHRSLDKLQANADKFAGELKLELDRLKAKINGMVLNVDTFMKQEREFNAENAKIQMANAAQFDKLRTRIDALERAKGLA